MKRFPAWLIPLVLLLAVIGWQEIQRRAQAEQIRALRNEAVRLQQPEQVNDSTQVVGALQGELLERDRDIEKLKRQLDASTRAQADIRLQYEADLAALQASMSVRASEATAEPVNDSLSRYDVPFSAAAGDSTNRAVVAGSVSIVQPGPDYLPSLGVQLERVSMQAEVQIDLVEDEHGWRGIVRSSTSTLKPTVKLAVLPRGEPWFERVKFSAGLGMRGGSPLVFSGVRFDPWGFGVTAGSGVGVFIYKTF
jgi:hypothetical protein